MYWHAYLINHIDNTPRLNMRIDFFIEYYSCKQLDLYILLHYPPIIYI